MKLLARLKLHHFHAPNVHVPHSVAHLAHRAHVHVQRLEAVSHAYYLGMVAMHADYALAAGLMLGTVIVGAVLHAIIAVAGEL